MRPDDANEVECPRCGHVHYSWPKRLCGKCRQDDADRAADYHKDLRKERYTGKRNR